METRKVFITIKKLHSSDPESLQLQPECFEDIASYNEKTIIDFDLLLRQLKDYGLTQNEDYDINLSDASIKLPQIVFKQKSLVVRALYSIPSDIIHFSNFYFTDCHNEKDLEKLKRTFALMLTTKNCYINDMAFVKQAQLDTFNDLKKDILNIESNNHFRKSDIIIQLHNEIDILSQREDPLFDNTNLMLLISAVNYAYDIERHDTTNKNGLLFQERQLMSAYKELILKYAPYVPQLFTHVQHATKHSLGHGSNIFNPNQLKINMCYQLICGKNNVESKEELHPF